MLRGSQHGSVMYRAWGSCSAEKGEEQTLVGSALGRVTDGIPAENVEATAPEPDQLDHQAGTVRSAVHCALVRDEVVHLYEMDHGCTLPSQWWPDYKMRQRQVGNRKEHRFFCCRTPAGSLFVVVLATVSTHR